MSMRDRVLRTVLSLSALVAATLAAPAHGEPLKVVILAGQSNMQGHARTTTFDAMALDPSCTALLAAMRNADGTPKVCERVWISSIGCAESEQTGRLTVGFGASGNGPKIGPEYMFGIELEQHLSGPILLIKTSWGGKSLHTDFRPPSAGPYEPTAEQLKNVEQRGDDVEAFKADAAKASGAYYRLMMEHVQAVLADPGRVVPGHDPAQGIELVGFVWFQGWNDMVDSGVYPERGRPGGYDRYSELLAQFIREVRADLDAPALPFVIGVMGVGGPLESFPESERRNAAVHGGFRAAMAAPAALPEFRGSVVAVQTAECWDMQVAALRTREAAIKDRVEALRKAMKDGAMPRAEGDAAIEALYAETFSADELVVLRESVSNADYHYMGSGKVMGRIGKAFADALLGLRETAKRD